MSKPKTRIRWQGFTLIEVVAVILVIGVIAAVAVPRLLDLRSGAEQVVVESYVGSLRTARQLAHSTMVLAGVSYEPFTLYTFVGMEGEPSQPLTINASGTINGHSIGVTALRQSVIDPSVGYIWSSIATGSDQFQFLTRTGRTVTIVHDQTSGAITWTATPSY